MDERPRPSWAEAIDFGRVWGNSESSSRKRAVRCHEAKAADVDGDGDIDICSKPWNGNEHIYLCNMLKEDSPR